MFPLINIANISIPTYSVFFYLGISLGIVIIVLRAKKYQIPKDEAFYFSLIVFVGAYVGAKILFLIVEIPTFLSNPSLLKYAVNSGFVYYGGFIGGAIAAFIYCRSYKLPIWDFANLSAPSVALGHSIGRIGCFMTGCCYGAPTTSPLGIVYKNSIVAPPNISLHPVQLYEAVGNLILFLVLIIYSRYKFKQKRVFPFYLILYSVLRFTIEFFRDDPRGALGLLSTSQVISIFLFTWGIFLCCKNREAI